jgi:hypothetical protein
MESQRVCQQRQLMRLNKREWFDCDCQQCSLRQQLQRCYDSRFRFQWSEVLRRVDECRARGSVRMELQRSCQQQQLMRNIICKWFDCDCQQCSLRQLQRCYDIRFIFLRSEVLRRVDECRACGSVRMESQRVCQQRQLMRLNKREWFDCEHQQCSLRQLQRCYDSRFRFQWSEVLRRVDECRARGSVRMESQRFCQQQQLMRNIICKWFDCDCQQCSLRQLQRCYDSRFIFLWSEVLRRVDECRTRGSVRMELQPFCNQQQQLMRLNRCKWFDCDCQQCSLRQLQRCYDNRFVFLWSEVLRRVDECRARGSVRIELQPFCQQRQLMRLNRCKWFDCDCQQCSLRQLQRCFDNRFIFLRSELVRRVDECRACGSVRMESQRVCQQRQLMRLNKREWFGCEHQQCSLRQLQRCYESI